MHRTVHGRSACPLAVRATRLWPVLALAASVCVHAWAGPTKTLAELEDLVRRLVEKEQIQPEQITLLTPHSRPNSLLRDRDDLAGWPPADDPLDREGSLLYVFAKGDWLA